MKRNVTEALIGAAVLVIAAWFLWFTSKVADFGNVSGYTLTATFDRIDGVNVGSDVMLGGIKVGSVLETAVNPDTYQAIVRFSVAPKIKLPADTSVEVSTQGLLGTAYLSLKPGGEPEYLADGDAIEFTQGSIDVVDIIGKAIFSETGEKKADESAPQP
jgi:phospholipid/cholesterol/gamma-HCH transport system substrate-binding protein